MLNFRNQNKNDRIQTPTSFIEQYVGLFFNGCICFYLLISRMQKRRYRVKPQICPLRCCLSVHHPPTLYRLCSMVPGTVDYPTVSHVGPTTLFPMYCLRLLLYTAGTVRTTLRSLKRSATTLRSQLLL